MEVYCIIRWAVSASLIEDLAVAQGLRQINSWFCSFT